MSDFLQRFGKGTRSMWMLFVGCLVFQVAAATADDFTLKSPDGKLAIDCSIDAEGALGYKIDYAGSPIVLKSRLGFEPDMIKDFQFVRSETKSHAGEWAKCTASGK